MANNLEAVIPQLLAQGLLALRENCVMPKLVNSDYESMAGQKGSTINVPIPSAVTAQPVVPSNVAPATGDISPTSVDIKLDQWIEAPFYLTDKELMECIEGTIPMQASEAIKALASAVDAFILSKYYLIHGVAGTAGTTPFSGALGTTSATEARKVLNKQLAPMMDRRAVLDPDAEASALNLRAFQDVSWAGSGGVINDGELGSKLGFVWHMDQNIPTHVAGTLQAAADSVVVGLTPAGATEIVIGSVTGGTLVMGDVVSFAGSTETYAVVANATVPAAGTATVQLSRPLVYAVADAAAVTILADHVVNLCFHRDCFAFANRPLADNKDGLGNIIESAVDPVSGLTLRLEVSREHKRTRYSYDILFGAMMVRSALGVRLLG